MLKEKKEEKEVVSLVVARRAGNANQANRLRAANASQEVRQAANANKEVRQRAAIVGRELRQQVGTVRLELRRPVGNVRLVEPQVRNARVEVRPVAGVELATLSDNNR